ncbi:MAG: hypothetical protein AB1768_17290 [Pseudomonadota bacterium]
MALDYGVRLLRRTVADIRHQLAIPDCRRRGHRMNYLVATAGFSALIRFGGRPAQALGGSPARQQRQSAAVLLHRRGGSRVRFRPVSEGWRRVERELCRVFCETCGAPPLANRMSP